MPRRGRRSEAQKKRWKKHQEAEAAPEPGPEVPSTPPGPAGTHGPTASLSSPSATSSRTKDSVHSPVQCPPAKALKTQTPPQPRSVCETLSRRVSRRNTHKVPSRPAEIVAVEPPTCSYSSAKKPEPRAEAHPEVEGQQQRERGCAWSVRASHSQSDGRYQEFSRNKQCTCMALTFLAHHSEHGDFNTADLDRVLANGDSLYVGIKTQLIKDNRFQNDYLAFDELPKQVLTDTDMYDVHMSEVKFGVLGGNDDWLSLAQQLESLATDVDRALLLVAPECIAVFRCSSGRYGVFDSHSRSERGLPHPGGTAVMLTFTHLSDLIAHIDGLFKDRGLNASYDFQPVSFESTQDTQHPAADVVSQREEALHISPPAPPAQGNVKPHTPQHKPQSPQTSRVIEQPAQTKRHLSKLNKQRRRKALTKTQSVQKCKKDCSRKDYMALRYKTCPVVRQQKRDLIKSKYSSDVSFREKQKLSVKLIYHHNQEYRQKQKSRYTHNQDYRQKQKMHVMRRYANDKNYWQLKKANVASRYAHDPIYREDKQISITSRYASDQDYRLKQKQYFHSRYHIDPEFRSTRKQFCNQYKRDKLSRHLDMNQKRQRALQIKHKYRELNRQKTPRVDPQILAAIILFKERIKNGPTYICTVCHRILFPNQVKRCVPSKYLINIPMVNTCLTGKYVHVCNCDCTPTCTIPPQRKVEWICATCDSHLKRGSMPAIAVANELELSPIPPELADLNVLERQLIAKILPFAKIVALPKGQQRAVRGAVVCVPSEVETTVNCLPRPTNDAQLLQVKLKRNIKYKGYQHFYTVSMKNVIAGLNTLKRKHSEYKDVTVDESVTFDSLFDDWSADEEEKSLEQRAEEAVVSKSNPDREQEELRPGLDLDTCMQPPDIAQDILTYGQGIFSVAPAQGNRPVGFFATPKLEAMAFPVQFPTGGNTLDEARQVKLTPSVYFNARLFCADTRFAKDQTYLFFAQFVTETYLATNSMSIQLRKGKPFTSDGRRISNQMLQDKEQVEKLIAAQYATRFMQCLRGTPAFWEKALKDLMAMVRQLGKPTFFLTFSAAESRWPEVIEILKAQAGEMVDLSKLDWNAKCDILRSNPVTVMRLFDKRVEALMQTLILSKAHIIGEVEDFFYRVEFQARGSPHIHLVVWVKDAPKVGVHTDYEVRRFIDKYVTCRMPDPKVDPELHKIVSEVQVHSRNHSKSCRKGNVECRFGYPRLPMDRTRILEPPAPKREEVPQGLLSEGASEPKSKGKRSRKALSKAQLAAKEKLKPLRDLISDPKASFKDLEDLLRVCNMKKSQYVQHVTALSTGVVLHLKRHPNDCWVNNYNPHLLRAWNANMDIQYVLDEYSCVAYMMSYLSKPEHEMSETLKQVVNDVRKKGVDERGEMKQIMQAYSKHREVSAQESVARTCSLALKRCSRAVVFIQTDENAVKMSHPMGRLKQMSPDDENIWMSGLPDKYAARPLTPRFERMCLAKFASSFRILYGRQAESASAIPLLDDKGYIQERTRGKDAVIRFPRFSEKKDPERFYLRLLKLYLPHRFNHELKTVDCPTYQQFYTGGVRFGYKIKDVVDRMKKVFEGHGKKIDMALELFENTGGAPYVWSTFASEAELSRLECIAERKPSDAEQDQTDDVPEFQIDLTSMPGIQAPALSVDYVRMMNQGLNETQASIFYTVRDWCHKLVWGHSPQQFFYFVTGGAGCGKSHVIKSIHEEATKILRQLPTFRDRADMSTPAVLLTSFTGTAAFNISGQTLHSLLKLPRSLRPPYQALGNSLDAMRAVLSNAQILIIDEISMVSKELFAYVHWRFQQIHGNQKPFGGISVLAVGDFYQLPPVRNSKPLCVDEGDVLDLWTENFEMVNLTQIMRQKDDCAFAELLNRLRVKTKTEPLADQDRALLTQAVTDVKDCPSDVLYIFATNKEVNRHNSAVVAARFPDVVNIRAEDFRKDPTTGRMLPVCGLRSNQQDLPDNIQAAPGVRVMLIRNLDVEDGLVNGTFGTIGHIVTRVYKEVSEITKIGLRLDSPIAGQKCRSTQKGVSEGLVYIEKTEEGMSKKGVVRRQFPMKLAFACTAHKVQGMTMQSAVVSLKHIFQPGMSYVALSRTTSLQGLRITDFDEKTIFADPRITAALREMKQLSFSSMPILQLNTSGELGHLFLVVHHNAQGLPSHIDDLRCHHELKLADVLCITETHLTGSDVSPRYQLDGYNMFARSRHLSYSSYPDMARKAGGGVAIYCKGYIEAQERRYIQSVTDLECLVVKVEFPVRAVIAAVYRPPNFSLERFLPNLKALLQSLAVMDYQQVIVCGDFNEDLLSKGKKAILELFQSNGYTQLITVATTDGNTLLDHIYVSSPLASVRSGALQTYYSYHCPVFCALDV